MNVPIDPKLEQRLQSLAQASGRTVAEVIQEIVQRGLEQTPANGGPAQIDATVWKPQLLRFLDEMNTLPLESPGDVFSGADHDDVLYPRKP